MFHTEIEQLVSRVDDNVATDGELVRLAELLTALERAEPLGLGSAIRAEGGGGFVLAHRGGAAGSGDVSVELDSILDDPLLPIADAVRNAAGPIDISKEVIAEIGAGLPVAEVVRDELAGEVPIAAAVRAEAGRVDIVPNVLATLALVDVELPIADAVRYEAGSVDVSVVVCTTLGFEIWPVGEAVRYEAGDIDIVDDVMTTIAPLEEGTLSAAIFNESGSFNFTDLIMAKVTPPAESSELPEGWLAGLLDRELSDAHHVRAAEKTASEPAMAADLTRFAELGRELRLGIAREAGAAPMMWAGVAHGIGIADPEAVPGWDGKLFAEAVREQAGKVDVVAEVMRRVKKSASSPVLMDVPVAANNSSFTWAAVAVAAVALFTLLLGREIWQANSASEIPVIAHEPVAALHFAGPGEIVVEDLSYGADSSVQVIQEEGDDGALIIWIDEEIL